MRDGVRRALSPRPVARTPMETVGRRYLFDRIYFTTYIRAENGWKMKLRNWNDIKRSRFTDEERAAIKERARAELVFEMNLPELRNAVGKTQLEVAEAAEMAQANVSEFERRNDHILSVLRRYIAALGGELEVSAIFDNKRVRLKGV